MPDQTLTARIVIDTTGAPQAIGDVDARLNALAEAFARNTVATDALTAALDSKATPGLRRHAVAATEAANGVDYLANHWRVATSAGEAFGLEATVVGARLAALSEVVEGLEHSFAPLLVAIIAFEVAMKGFEFVKQSTEVAAGLQAQMETLGAAVRTHGGDWEKIKSQVEEFVATEAMASGFLRSQLLPAMNELVNAGHSVADSETILAVAEEVAIAHHKEVGEVVSDLISLELGRGRAIEKLDPAIKGLDKSNASLADKLALLHEHSKNALDDDTSLERAHARLKAEIEGVQKEIGDNLLPVMADLDYTMLGGIRNVALFATAFGKAFRSIGDEARAVGFAVKGAFEVFRTDGSADRDFAAAAAAQKKSDSEDALANAAMVKWQKSPDAYTLGHQIADNARRRHAKDLPAKIKEVTAVVAPTEAKTSTGEPSISFSPADYKTEHVDHYAASQKQLDEALKHVDDSEKSLAERIKLAGSAMATRSAQAAYDAQVIVDLQTKQTMLTAAIHDETIAQQQLDAAHAKAEGAAHAATDAYNAYGKSILKSGTNTIAQQNELAILKDRMDKANTAAADFKKSLDTVSSSLDKNKGSLETVIAKLGEFKDHADEAVASASRAWESYQKKRDEQMHEEAATAHLTNDEKFAYYSEMLNRLTALEATYRAQFLAADAAFQAAVASKNPERIRATALTLATIQGLVVDTEKLMESADSKEAESFKAALKDREAAEKAYVDRVRGYETGFLDDILLKHQSLGQSLKNVFGNILTDWVHMIEQMVVKSALMNTLNGPNGAFGKFFQSIGMGAALGAGAMGAAPDPAAQAAYTAFVSAETHATQTTTLRSTAEDGATRATAAATTALGTFTTALQRAASSAGSGGGGFDPLSMLGGSSGAGVPDLANAAGGSWGDVASKDVNIAGVGGKDVSSMGGALPTDTKAIGGSSSAATAFGGAMQGLMIAQMVNGITGGNSTWSSVGGAIGGAFGGPLGAVAGSAIGGLFGPHWGPKSNQPDQYNPDWGKADTNWNGDTNQDFNGQKVSADAAYNTSMGGTSMSKTMEAWANSAAATTDAQKALQKQIVALEAGNPNANLGITSEKNGIAYLANGQQIAVTDLIAMQQQYSANVGTGPMSSSVFELTRTYPNMNLGKLNPNGTYTQTPITVPPGNTSNPGATVDGNSGGGGNLTVNVQIDAKTVGQAVVPYVGGGMRLQDQNMTPGSPRAWGNSPRSKV